MKWAEKDWYRLQNKTSKDEENVMYIRVQLALTGNTSYVLHSTEYLIMILGITTFSLQLIETLFINRLVPMSYHYLLIWWHWILDARKFYAHKFTSITTCLYFICFYLLRQNLAEGLHEDKKEDIYPKK